MWNIFKKTEKNSNKKVNETDLVDWKFIAKMLENEWKILDENYITSGDLILYLHKDKTLRLKAKGEYVNGDHTLTLKYLYQELINKYQEKFEDLKKENLRLKKEGELLKNKYIKY